MPTTPTTQALPPLTWWGAMRWDALAPALPERTDLGVVEFGCGVGAFGARFASRYERYVGVEPDETSASVARERLAPFGGDVVADAGSVPDSSADLLCAFEVLEHLKDDRDVLASWTRIGAPGALVLLSVPAEPDRYGPWDAKVGHYRRYSRASVTELLVQCGLEPVDVRQYGYPFGYALETARNAVARRQGSAAEAPMEVRTESSGRQRQASSPLMGATRWALTAPFRQWQRRRPNRGPGLVAVARVPA